MNMMTVADASDFIRGITFKPHELIDPSDPDAIVCMRTKNIQADLDQRDLIAVPTRLVRQDQKLLRAGDILISSANSWELVGKCSYVPELPYRATAGGFIAIVRPKSQTHPRFLYHWLNSPATQHVIRNMGRQTTNISNLDVNRFKEIELPAFDFDEQSRIAAILDKADAIRRQREQALTLADDFLRSVFLEMFGEPNTNRLGLNKVPLGDIIRVSSGNGLVGKNMAADGIYPVYGGNGINGHHSEYMFEEPQIVIGRVGAYCGAVHVSAPKSWVTDNALYIRTYKEPINKTYLEWALRFANLNQYAGRAAQPLISGGRIYEVEILVPEDADQLSFHRIVQKHSILVSKLKSDAVNSGDLFAALSQRAFAGDL